MPYLVDGNNLAHALGLATGAFADREACARTVSSFCRSHGAQATIIFDGPAPLGLRAATATHRVRIVFGEGRSADELILAALGNSKTPGDFIVVTSDKSLGDKARHRGAAVERAHEFARRLERKPMASGASPEKPARRETREQIDAWLAVFDPDRR